MKTTLLGGVVGAALIMVGMQSPAIATTYNYVGNSYTHNDDPAPHASFGTNMTGSVTVDFDTTGYTGQITLESTGGHISDLYLKSGLYSVSISQPQQRAALAASPGSWIYLENGLITEWWIDMFTHPTGDPDMLTTHRTARTRDFLDPVYGNTPPNFQAFVDNAPGTWSVTPLPAALPLFGTGLSIMGLLGWRRKRKSAAALAA